MDDKEKSIRIARFIDNDDDWAIIREIIEEEIERAKTTVFDAKGEIADFDRGWGKGLESLIVSLENTAINGREFLKQEQSRSK